MYLTPILIGIFTTINITAFFITAYDKRKSISRNNPKRTPEGQIFFLAACFGSIGVYIAMQLFRHKTRKWYFQLGILLLILQNLATLYALREIITHVQ